ncbi:glycerate kinase family protein [Furfurilactobacillus rossiae]|uniref:Glycerate kinase n=1 Tax=Furfurilactobacillus rossiae DSM 15814 TaxID=1114972 RepID=A0A0R1RJX0_9LACO|nr:glycerate kinase [Furfurilactobacillus rossiae]KRL54501.1 glycerate kinase [Furfurilactobacillus rossiae DSM 15814]QFR67383.1 glycerate kinase [Furfurilactobacillus rossiae]QLE60323.1 Glycerate kinase [Furfurilactobacillus rossiae]
MKFVIAPDSFKGSLTAKEAADAIETGIKRIFPDADYENVPMADGGEGTVQSLVDATHGTFRTIDVLNPLQETVPAEYGILGDGQTAVIEMAAASGIQFVNDETKNPLITTTYGTGQLIADALQRGATEIIIGIGGSATTDGGAGMAEALGAKFLDASGSPINRGGGGLADLATIDVSGMNPLLMNAHIRIASDVTNPLVGKTGSAAVFGPQKGATPEMVKQLDANLAHYAEVLRTTLGVDLADYPGSGAAGGLGAGLLAFTNAKMEKGVEIVVQMTKLKERAKDADFVFTGEGGIDFQTQYGKTPMGTAQAAHSVSDHVTVIALAGNVGKGIDQLYDLGIDVVMGILPGVEDLPTAVAHAKDNLTNTAENVARLIRRARK